MQNMPSKLGRPRPPAYVGVSASAEGSVVSQGRREGQPKLVGGVQNKSPAGASARDQPTSGPVTTKNEVAGKVFGLISSVPEAERSGKLGRKGLLGEIRAVHPEKGPYRTIQAALAEAQENDIVSVSPGFYAEQQLNVQLDTVRIVGKVRDGGEVVLECGLDKFSVLLDREAGNLRLENIIFRKGATAGEDEEARVGAGAMAGLAALQNKVKHDMLAIAKAETNRLNHDVKKGGYAAIVSRGRTTFLNCTFSGLCGGVLVTGPSAEALVFGCHFSAVPAGLAAVQVEERARARIRKGIFEKCIGMGVQIINSECTIDDNSFTDMYNYAIQIAVNSAGNIRDNRFVGGRKASVAVSGLSSPLIERNFFTKSYATGVFVFDGGKPNVEANDFVGCMLAAIEIRDEGSDPIVINNTIRDGSDGGIVVHNHARGTIKVYIYTCIYSRCIHVHIHIHIHVYECICR